jgi:hypothetical protein
VGLFEGASLFASLFDSANLQIAGRLILASAPLRL